MRHNKNFSVRSFYIEKFSDGKPLTLPIDQFPVNDKSFYKEDGFPASQIELLDRYSRDANFNEDEIKAIVSRIQDTNDNDDSSKFTQEQKLALLKPAWCQTSTEVKEYELRVGELLSSDLFKSDSTDASVDEVPSVVVEETNDSDEVK